MSMPQITLEDIDPRIALASIVASIALQEAAVSHVLNAEGEKIQAVVNMPDASIEDLQNVNLSVGDLVVNVADFSDALQEKLETALEALFPVFSLTVFFVDSVTTDPVECTCVVCTLVNLATGVSSTFYAEGDFVTLTGLRPGNYTLNMADLCPGYALNMTLFNIVVDESGNITFNGSAVTEGNPAEIELTEDPLAVPGSISPLCPFSTSLSAEVTVAGNRNSVPYPNIQTANYWAAEVRMKGNPQPIGVAFFTDYEKAIAWSKAPTGDWLTISDPIQYHGDNAAYLWAVEVWIEGNPQPIGVTYFTNYNKANAWSKAPTGDWLLFSDPIQYHGNKTAYLKQLGKINPSYATPVEIVP